MQSASIRITLLSVAASFVLSALSGCGAGSPAGSAATPFAIPALTGAAHGGQQPIAGSLIQLMAPGQTGYGSAPSLLATAITSATGGFTLPAYTCPTGSSLVYILATGGNSGAGVNPLIAEAAVLGPCSSLSASTFINITEVTTVAAAYALAPFASVTPAATSIGTSPTNLLGLASAFGPANNLAPFTSGSARAANALPGMILPTSYVNTLANILASCINSTGATSGNCGTLFTNTTVAGVPPADTFQAALNLAQHPGANVVALFNLAAPAQVYAPALATAPADFTLAITYTGGPLSLGGGALSVAIDAQGNAWASTASTSTVHCLTQISPAGVYFAGSTVAATSCFGAANLTRPVGLAIDPSGNVIVDDNATAHLVKFNSAGTFSATVAAPSLYFPNGISIDGSGNSWVANFGHPAATEVLASGTEATTSPYTVPDGSVDAASGPKATWITSYNAAHTISRIDLTTFAVTSVGIGGSTAGVAIDHANNAWIAVTGNGSIFKVSDSGTVLNPFAGYVQGAGAQNVAVDGLGNVFAGVYLGTSVSGAVVELSNSGTALSSGSGYIGAGLLPNLPQAPHGIAIDGSGNLWLAGTNNGATSSTYLSEIIGIAAPVVTPLSLAAKTNTLGTRP